MTLHIRPILPAEHDAARALLSAHGWAPRMAEPGLFVRLLSRSQAALVAVERAKTGSG